MSIGCVVILLATVISCAHMCSHCEPCFTCSNGNEPYLSNQQMTSLKQHEARIRRLTEHPELLHREENQQYIIQLTEKQLQSIYKTFCFYFVDTPLHLREKIGAFEIEDDQLLEGNTEALQGRSLPDGGSISHTAGAQSTFQHADSLSVERSSSKPLEETVTRSKDILPGRLGLNSGKQPLEDNTTDEIGKRASDQEFKQRKRRHENDEEADDPETEDGEGTYDDDERSDTEAFSEEAETMCSAKEVEYPVVLYINAAGSLVQLILSESYYQPLVNERCSREFHTVKRDDMTATCLTTYRLAQVYALNLATLQFGREIIRITQCTPVIIATS
ncbi:uncharacterized protein LOC105437584 [Strongylocentrotus purpuratus]|uniref:Uncharacterized protein n=1 Tax=Strongylocentrotus purpuratus TaxID=7668 RepID=A0A7M7N1G6_STRPU|nr:uncharacterized protein LOC105437584 [Strongylocentrotus purpuratus]